MSSRTRRLIQWSSLAGLLISLVLGAWLLPLERWTASLDRWLEELGHWGPVVFVGVYIVATVCLAPASLLTLAAGAAFGIPLGFAAASLGSLGGAAAAFLVARYAARRHVQQLARRFPKFGAVDQAIAAGGWKIVGLLRLSPAIPFNLQNYLYGLTAIRFWPYLLVSWIAMMPGTLLYVYLGHVAGRAVAGQGELGGSADVARWSLLIVGLLATLAVTLYVSRVARRKLRELQLPGGGPNRD